MKFRSDSACGSWASASGSWQETQIASFSMSVSEAFGVEALAARAPAGSASAHATIAVVIVRAMMLVVRATVAILRPLLPGSVMRVLTVAAATSAAATGH